MSDKESAEEENQLMELSFPRPLADDWAGVSSPKERKKIQNRLAQRAYRQRNSRKGNLQLRIKFFNPNDRGHVLDPAAKGVSTEKRSFLNNPVAAPADTPSVTNTNDSNQALGTETDGTDVPAPDNNSQGVISSESSILEFATYSDALISMRVKGTSEDWVDPLFGQSCMVPIDHEFINLIYYNVFRAFEVNTGSLGLTTRLLTLDILSPFNLVSLGGTILEENVEKAVSITPALDPTRNLPPALLPTMLQITVLHHPYIDLFPSPRLRDNLLARYGMFDEDELCFDVMGHCDGVGHGLSGLIVWGDPWIISSWEVAEHFVQKWSWMVEGCDDLIQSSNYWRGLRGLPPMNISV